MSAPNRVRAAPLRTRPTHRDHQFIQDIYISALGPLGPNDKFDEERSGWGWKQIAKVDKDDTSVTTTCKMQRP
jgi:branched-chain amino acid transport system substrate-binding protein